MFQPPCVCVDDFRDRARRRLPRWVFDYLDGGADAERTLDRNRAVLDGLALRPSALVDVSAVDTTTDFFGRPAAAPMAIGPTGLNGLLHHGGDIALARAAAQAGVPFVQSTASTTLLEDVARAVPDGDLWYQLYVLEDRSIARQLLRRARAAGFRVLVLTVDVPMSGKRRRDMRNAFRIPFRVTPRLALDCALHPGWSLDMLRHGAPEMVNLAEPGQVLSRDAQAALLSRRMDLTLTWDDLEWLRDQWDGPFVLKGILNPADAARAADAGVDGIVLSNHGGRQLDGAVSALEVLPEVLAVTGGRMSVFVDGGVRGGTDIAKARALGADAVFLGRATLYGLAAAGEAGARDVLAVLEDELRRALTLLGCPRAADLGPSVLGLPPAAAPAKSAFSILEEPAPSP